MVPIIIPAYEPDARLPELLGTLKERNMGPIVIVDDGSGDAYKEVFAQAEPYARESGGAILTHEVNKGKGRALKTAFAYVLKTWPDAIGCVTADSDGQHSADCIKSIRKALEAEPDHLILGVRKFDGEDVPWRSRAGNTITEAVFAYVSGIHVSDTQTGLRGIPKAFMQELLDVPGERFEFETQMLLETAGKYPITEVPIKTIYDSRENHQTHFNTFTDSVKIYRILLKNFGKYIFSSISSCLIDLALFALLCSLMRGKVTGYVAISTVLARVVSGIYNYLITYLVVFKSKEKISTSGMKFLVLAIVQMSLSAALVTGFCSLLPGAPEIAVKAVVDVILFFISFTIQQKYIFGKGRGSD